MLEVKDVLNEFKDSEYLSISSISRKCCVGFVAAEKLLDEIIDLGLVEKEETSRGHKVNNFKIYEYLKLSNHSQNKKVYKTRNEIVNENKGSISDEEILLYLKRLIKPYDGKQFFASQYINADGHELSGKFFSKISSSRLAFELYSWMANEKNIKNFVFEKKLPGIKGSPKSPNMDVYFERGDEIHFIESKYTETTYNKKGSIPESYYKEDAIGTNGAKVKTSLLERYNREEKLAKEFSEFVNEVNEKYLDGKKSWFDIKQEVTHLFGICMFMINNKHFCKNKILIFENIVYGFSDYKENEKHEFVKLAENLLNKINQIYSIGLKTICYRHDTCQNFARVFISEDKNAFGLENITVREQLTRYFYFNF